MAEPIEAEEERADVEGEEVEIEAAAAPPSDAGGLFATLARRRTFSPLAFAVAVSAHIAVIGAGVWYVRNAVRPREQLGLVLPYGWVADHDGHGDAGATGDTVPVVLFPPRADEARTAATSRDALGQPPGELQTPEVPPSPPVVLDATRGTADLGPLPTLAADTSPPAMHMRYPPGYAPGERFGPDAGNHSATPPPAPPSDNAFAAASGTTSTGAGAQDGGGQRGSQTGTIDAQAIPVYYPSYALEKGWGGTTGARFDVDERGRVRNIRVTGPSGRSILDDAVVEGLKRWSPPKVLWGTVDNAVPFVFNPDAARPSRDR